MNEVLKILKNVRYATVSTVDNSGNPWAAPVWYVYDNAFNIYWWSPVESIHSRNILNNRSVCITIFDSTLPEGEGIGVYMKADATEVPTADIDKIIKIYNNSTEIYRLDMDNCSGNAPTRLYKAAPNQLWLNDGETQSGYWVDTRKEIIFN